jgi:hypothetical protein
MALKDDVVAFLRTDPNIAKINFEFDGFRVYPSAYSADVADAIAAGRIGVRTSTALNAGAGASYDPKFNEFNLAPTFSLGRFRDAALLVHEATHAHMDLQAAGRVARERAEAIGYLAEAVYVYASGYNPLSAAGTEGGFLRAQTERLATSVLAGGYKVPPESALALIGTLRNEQHYIDQTADEGPEIPFDGVPR